MLSFSHYPNEQEKFQLEAQGASGNQNSLISTDEILQEDKVSSPGEIETVADSNDPVPVLSSSSSKPAMSVLQSHQSIVDEPPDLKSSYENLQTPPPCQSIGVQTIEEEFPDWRKRRKNSPIRDAQSISILSPNPYNLEENVRLWKTNNTTTTNSNTNTNTNNSNENNKNTKINIPLSIVTLQSILIAARAKAATKISPKQFSIYQLSNDIMLLMQESLKSERSAYNFLSHPIINVEGEKVDRMAWWFWIIQRSVEELNPSPGFILPSLKMLRQEISGLADVAVEVINIQKTIQNQLQRMAGVLNNVFARYEDLFGVKEWETKLNEMRMKDGGFISEKFEKWLRKSKSYNKFSQSTDNSKNLQCYNQTDMKSQKSQKSKSKVKSNLNSKSVSNSTSRSGTGTGTGYKTRSRLNTELPTAGNTREILKLTAFESKTLLVQHETSEEFPSVSINKLSVKCRKEFIKACLDHINTVLRRSCNDSQKAHEELRKSEKEIKSSIDRLVRKLDNLRRNHRFQESNCALLLKKSLNSLGLCLYEFIDIVRFIIKLGRFVLLASEHVLRFANGWSHLCDVSYLSQLDVILEEFSESQSFTIFPCFKKKEKRKTQRREMIMTTFDEYFQKWVESNTSTVQVTLPVCTQTSDLIFAKEDADSMSLASSRNHNKEEVQPFQKFEGILADADIISLKDLQSSKDLDVKIIAKISRSENESIAETLSISAAHKLEEIGIKIPADDNVKVETNKKLSSGSEEKKKGKKVKNILYR